MKKLSSRQAKAKAISPTVKFLVTQRDGGRCVCCGAPGLPEAHFIRRSKGGLGVPKNIVTLCRSCHDKFDNGPRKVREGKREEIRQYLQSIYPDWSEDALVYHKEGQK